MAVEFMSDMLQNSVLARKHFEDERMVILEEISMRDDDPSDLIHDLFGETVWQGHPLGRPVLGTRETVGVGVAGPDQAVLRPAVRAGAVRGGRSGKPRSRAGLPPGRGVDGHRPGVPDWAHRGPRRRAGPDAFRPPHW